MPITICILEMKLLIEILFLMISANLTELKQSRDSTDGGN
jgi:hypothetical protein